MAGFIYVFSNPSLEGLKIGKTKSDPAERARELSTTSVPSPFKVEYFAFVDDFDRLERDVHRRLDKYRKNKNREFFDCSVTTAMDAIRTSAGSRLRFEETSREHEKKAEQQKASARKAIGLIHKAEEMQRIIDTEKDKREDRQRLENERIMRENVKSSGNLLDIYLFWLLGISERQVAFVFPVVAITVCCPLQLVHIYFLGGEASYGFYGFFIQAFFLSLPSSILLMIIAAFRLSKYEADAK